MDHDSPRCLGRIQVLQGCDCDLVRAPRQHNPVNSLLHSCTWEIRRMIRVQAKGKALIQRLRLMREKPVGTVQARLDKILEHPDLRQLRQVTRARWKGLLVIKTWMTISGDWRREMVKPWNRKHWAKEIGKERNLPMLWWMLEVVLPGKWWIMRGQEHWESMEHAGELWCLM